MAIVKAHYDEGWTDLSNHDMCGKRLEDEKIHMNKLLDPVQGGWEKYRYRILFKQWSDRKKLGLSNTFVSSLLVAPIVVFAQGVKKTLVEFIVCYIWRAIIEVNLVASFMLHV